MRTRDVFYFLAEIAVYVAVAWWGVTRDAPLAARWALGLGGLVVFAVAWGTFAAPKARRPLSGGPDRVFRCAWFGLAALAGAIAILGS